MYEFRDIIHVNVPARTHHVHPSILTYPVAAEEHGRVSGTSLGPATVLRVFMDFGFRAYGTDE